MVGKDGWGAEPEKERRMCVCLSVKYSGTCKEKKGVLQGLIIGSWW